MSSFKDSEIIDLMYDCGYLANEEEKGEVTVSELNMFKEFAELTIKLWRRKERREK